MTDQIRYRAIRWVALAPQNHPLMADMPDPVRVDDPTGATFDAAVDRVADYLIANGVKL